MDIGFGTPYAAMQKSKAPIRIVFQLSKLKFFPVTSQKYSKLEDLDGEPIMLHSRGGGTDSIANVIEDRLGIKFGERSYVPGSANRIVALIAGQTDATIVDLSNKNKLLRQEGDKFNVLPMFEVDASDEALFANLEYREIGPTRQSGRFVDIAVPSQQPYTFYIATASGHLWKTTNNGISFDVLFENEDVFSIGAIAVAPSDPSIIYVGSGEGMQRLARAKLNAVRARDDLDRAYWSLRSLALSAQQHILLQIR